MSIITFSQPTNLQNLTFEHLSIEHGLSQITVHAILQDSKGFLWIGTEYGLNRYDGYNFIVYQHDPSDTNSISDNFIWKIFEDSHNNLWIGTNSGGLNKYNYETNTFIRFDGKFNVDSPSNIRSIFEDSQNNLWIGTENTGLFVRRSNKDKFIRIGNEDNSDLSVRAICEVENEIIWIGTDKEGMFEVNLNGNQLYKNNNIKSNSIWALEANKSGNVWIGTYSDGLIKYNLKTKHSTFYKSTGSGRTLINNNITSLLLYDENLWICTEAGLSILQTKTGKFINYSHNLSNLKGISNSLLRVITKGNSNLIWIGTVGGGINKINLNKKFNQIIHNPVEENSLSHNMIRAIEEDSKGDIWIGTMGSGINRFRKSENKYQRINSANSLLTEDVVTSILEDSKNNLWVGTWGGGLNKFRFKNIGKNNVIESHKFFINNPNNNNSISSNIIQDIFEDSKGNLWIGTEDGLDKLELQSNSQKFKHYKNSPQNKNSLSDNRIQSRCLIEDRFGYLWIGTWQGLNRLKITDSSRNPKFIKFHKNSGLSDNRVISVMEDRTNIQNDTLIIWVGTIGGGLNKISAFIDNGEITNYYINIYKEKNGLPSNVIYGILDDSEGNLWLSTNKGISNFNPSKELFRNYNIDDGLQSNQFFWGAFHKTKNGELYFGGVNGINSFNPNSFIENKNIPPLYITKCKIESSDGKKKYLFDNIVELKKEETKNLPYDTYNISFDFSALDLTTPNKNSYKYILENFDDDWSKVSNTNYVNYTNLSDGKYVFKVIGSNNDGIWNKTGAEFSFYIETPFWKAWWFIVLIVISIAVLVTYLVITQIKNLLAVERIRSKLAADLHDNIGSSLTEISILTEVISTRLKSEDKDVIKSLAKISTKSRNLIDKMSDIVWLVNPKRDSLYDLILRLQDSYSDLLADTAISFKCKNLKSLEKVSLSMEHRQHLFLVFKEAINNAVTHSNCTELTLDSNVSGKILKMTLKDNGDGFDTELNSNGNGLDNMKDRASKIGGKLKVTSEKGIGTVVNYFGYIY